MKIAFLGDKGVANWHIGIFGKDVEYFVSDKNKHIVNAKKIYKLSNKTNILLALKNPIKSYKRLKENNFDNRLDFHYFELEQLVKNNYFEYVVVKSDRSLYTMATLKKKYNNFKLIYWFPAVIPFQDIFDKRSFFIRKYSFDLIDKFITLTNTAKETLILERINSEKIEVNYPGVNTQIFYKKDKNISKEKLKWKKDVFHIIFVGKLTSWKGIYTLIYALKLLQKYNIHLHLIGNGAQKETLRLVAKELKVDKNITFYGFVEHSKLNDFYNASDIFVLPSLPAVNVAEQFGFVVAEAMMCGLPTIVSNVGGLPEVVKHKELLFTPAHYQELASKIETLINNKILYNNLATHCLSRAKNFYNASINQKILFETLKGI